MVFAIVLEFVIATVVVVEVCLVLVFLVVFLPHPLFSFAAVADCFVVLVFVDPAVADLVVVVVTVVAVEVGLVLVCLVLSV